MVIVSESMLLFCLFVQILRCKDVGKNLKKFFVYKALYFNIFILVINLFDLVCFALLCYIN